MLVLQLGSALNKHIIDLGRNYAKKCNKSTGKAKGFFEVTLKNQKILIDRNKLNNNGKI